MTLGENSSLLGTQSGASAIAILKQTLFIHSPWLYGLYLTDVTDMTLGESSSLARNPDRSWCHTIKVFIATDHGSVDSRGSELH